MFSKQQHDHPTARACQFCLSVPITSSHQYLLPLTSFMCIQGIAGYLSFHGPAPSTSTCMKPPQIPSSLNGWTTRTPKTVQVLSAIRLTTHGGVIVEKVGMVRIVISSITGSQPLQKPTQSFKAYPNPFSPPFVSSKI